MLYDKIDIEGYCRLNPGLQLRDLFKYVYQSCYGCEHLVTDEKRVLNRIRQESQYRNNDTIKGVEPIGGGFCRLHLNIMNEGLTAETIAGLFMLSAEAVPGGEELFKAALDSLRVLSAEGRLPFTEGEVALGIAEWESNGFEAVHHSEEYRSLYQPAYRVLRGEYAKYIPVLCAVDRLLRQGSVIMAIDGRCASGKTTFAALLGRLYDCNVFHMDDFFLRPEQRTEERLAMPGENVDHERFLEEVLLPTSEGRAVDYRRYACSTGSLCAAVSINPKRLTVIEGSYSLHRELLPYYKLKVLTDISPEHQRERILSRNPDRAAMFFDRWIPLEERYLEAFKVRTLADYVIVAD